MPDRLPSPLPFFDRKLLHAVEKVVPAVDREEWGRSWRAELWHVHHPGGNRRPLSLGGSIDLSIGLLCDAIWLRGESWRRAFSGTAIACLASLAGLLLLSLLVGLALTGGWSEMRLYAAAPFRRFLAEAPLVVFVTFAIESRRYFDQRSSGARAGWIRRRLFFSAKTTFLLLLAFLLSADALQPIHAGFPNTADLFQTFFFVILALVGLRWAFQDQQQRCKQVSALAGDAGACGPTLAQLPGVEWHGVVLQAGARSAERSGDGDQLAAFQPVDAAARRVGTDRRPLALRGNISHAGCVQSGNGSAWS